MRIRQYGGLSVENMDTYGEAIRQLPAVTNEMRGIVGGRTDAAISVVRCAVAYLISDDVHFRLLSDTLLSVDRSKTLLERERESHKHLLDLSNNQVEHWRNAAYLDLASRLVSIRQTPCFEKDMADINGLLTHLHMIPVMIERQLVGMGVRLDPRTRERAAERILELFPDGATKAGAGSMVERTMVLIRAALYRLGNHRHDDSPEEHEFFWRYALLHAYYEVDPDSPVIRNVLREGNTAEIVTDAFRILAEAMEAEEYGGWPSIGGPGTDTAMVPVPAR